MFVEYCLPGQSYWHGSGTKTCIWIFWSIASAKKGSQNKIHAVLNKKTLVYITMQGCALKRRQIEAN
jgi:hypothetical protein